MSFEDLLAVASQRLGPDRCSRAIVFGSGPLLLAGLPRQPRDLDLYVATDLYQQLLAEGLPEQQDAEGHAYLELAPGIELWPSFPTVSWEQVSARARLDSRTHGLRVADLSHVRSVKISLGRPRDLADVQLIDALLGRFPEEDDPTESDGRTTPII
jgi:hypothetical protein